jgi:hypothetical protein
MRSPRALAALIALPLLIASCGGGDGGGSGDAGDSQPTAASGSEAPEIDGGTDTLPSVAEVEAPTFTLTGPVEPPAGWVLDPPNCVDADESGPPYFDHYVPADWVRRGSGASGSGGVTTNGDHDYELPDGSMVDLTVETDAYLGTDPTNSSGGVWESWDYDITTFADDGETTERITYEALDPVEIDGEAFDLYRLDQAQSEQVSQSEYKVRIVFGEVPTGGVVGQDRRPESATVTFSWDAESGELTEDQVRELLATFRLADCAQEGLVALYETITGADFTD